MGKGGETFLRRGEHPHGFHSLPPPLPKAFVFIESLLPAFPVDEKGI